MRNVDEIFPAGYLSCFFRAFGVRVRSNLGILMSYEILVGLNVLDDFKYNDYRAAMKPILSDYEGRFSYDFKVSEVLISEGNTDINRVFTINFSSKDKMESFFSDAQYLIVKDKCFITSVGSATIISSYDKAL